MPRTVSMYTTIVFVNGMEGEPMRLARETWLLLAIGFLDLVSTLWLIHQGLAWEANPIMGWYLEQGGIWALGLVKAILLVCPLAILEWVRSVRPSLAQRALRFALAGYLLLYSVLVWRVNGDYIKHRLASRMYQVSYSWRQREGTVMPSPHKPMMMIPLEQDSLCVQ